MKRDFLGVASNDMSTPALRAMVKMFKTQKELPFRKAIGEFREIMGSASLSPLDRLRKLQTLSINEQLVKHKDYVQ